MDLNGTEITDFSATKTRSVFYCTIAPEYKWELNDTTFSWIFVIINYIASPIAILLNIFVIILLNQRKELRKNSTILLTSLAVADLFAGAINMPLTATNDVLILRQVSFEHICFLVNVPGVYSLYFVSSSSLYNLTAIAWERYVAIVNWMDYKTIVTRKRLKRLAAIAWLGSVFTVFPPLFMQVAGVSIDIVVIFFFLWIVCCTVALTAIVYFYVMIYRGIHKRKISEISQVTALVKAKLESKVAKTTFLLTAAVIFSFVPATVFYILGEAFPVFRTSVSFRFWELVMHLNSLANPLLYFYRDRRFRNAVLELLQMKKPQPTQPVDGFVRHVRRKDPFDAVEDVLELNNLAKPTRLIRTTSCDEAVISDCVQHGRPYQIMLKRSMSAPTLNKCYSLSSLDNVQQQQPWSIMITTVTLHAERGQRSKMKKTIPKLPKDENLSQGTANRKISSSKSFHARTSVMFAKSCPDVDDKKRPRTAGPMIAGSTANLAVLNVLKVLVSYQFQFTGF